MSDTTDQNTTSEDTEQENTQPAEQKPAETKPASETLGDAGKKALDAERKARRDLEKELKELRDFKQAQEDAKKSDLEKAAEAAEKASKERDSLRAELLKLRAAAEHSIPADYHHLLTATDEEGLKAQAATVAELVQAKQTPEFASNPGQGVSRSTGSDTGAQIAAAESNGDFKTSVALKVGQYFGQTNK